MYDPYLFMNIEDEILIAGIRLGDFECFNRLFFGYYGRLCAYVTEIIKDEIVSEDIVQELFIKLWTNHEKLEIRDNLASYLFKSSKNAAFNHLRNEESRKNATNRIPQKPFENEDEFLEQDDFIVTLEKCIDQLPARSKQVFLMNRFEGMKNKEISEKLNVSVKTIKNQLWKSLLQLRVCMEHQEGFIDRFFGSQPNKNS